MSTKSTIILVLVAAWLPLVTFAQTPAQVVAAVICAESRSEGRAGMQAVYEVIWTRAKEHRLSPVQEVTRPRWYTSLNRTTPAALVRKMSKTPQWAYAVKLVSSPPATQHACGANHFTKASESPSWARGSKPVAILGKHAFYRLD